MNDSVVRCQRMFMATHLAAWVVCMVQLPVDRSMNSKAQGHAQGWGLRPFGPVCCYTDTPIRAAVSVKAKSREGPRGVPKRRGYGRKQEQGEHRSTGARAQGIRDA